MLGYYASWPTNVGSRRVWTMCRALQRRDFDVTLLTARPPGADFTPLTADVSTRTIDGINLIETSHHDRVLTIKRLAPFDSSGVQVTAGDGVRTWRARGRAALTPWLSFPDTMWPWRVAAQRAARHARGPIDIVVATGPPMAALAAGAKIAHDSGVPFLADLRDLWTGDPYRVVPRAARRVDRALEIRTLSHASELTTVAEPLARHLAERYDSRITVIRNGFDPTWMRTGDDEPAEPRALVFTGTLHSNRGRDVEPILRALGAAPITSRELHVYGSTAPAGDVGGTRVVHHGVVSPERVRRAQHEAALLLSIGWDDARDEGSCPAKLFEYAAARRPILHVGHPNSVGARLIVEHGLGVALSPRDHHGLVHALTRHLSPGTAVAPTPADVAPLSDRTTGERFVAVVDRILSGTAER
jgi:hypothetical protein